MGRVRASAIVDSPLLVRDPVAEWKSLPPTYHPDPNSAKPKARIFTEEKTKAAKTLTRGGIRCRADARERYEHDERNFVRRHAGGNTPATKKVYFSQRHARIASGNGRWKRVGDRSGVSGSLCPAVVA